MYLYECLCLLLGAALVGTAIGVILSYCLSVQLHTFLNSFASFEFPFIPLLILGIVSVALCFVVAHQATQSQLQCPISRLFHA